MQEEKRKQAIQLEQQLMEAQAGTILLSPSSNFEPR
jgi:hypothetical protein